MGSAFFAVGHLPPIYKQEYMQWQYQTMARTLRAFDGGISAESTEGFRQVVVIS
jgi:hypothetical protein